MGNSVFTATIDYPEIYVYSIDNLPTTDISYGKVTLINSKRYVFMPDGKDGKKWISVDAFNAEYDPPKI